jgi:hypothetical protein
MHGNKASISTKIKERKTMRCMICLATSLMVGVLLGGCGGSDGIPGIEPGARVGSLVIGGTFEEASRRLGPPERIEPDPDLPVVHAFWLSKGLAGSFVDQDLHNDLDSTEKCVLALASSPYNGRTAKEIGLGSSRVEVRRTYGQPEEVEGSTEWYWSLGIEFTYDRQGFVETLSVFEPIHRARWGSAELPRMAAHLAAVLDQESPR